MTPANEAPLAGIFPAVATPLDDDGRLDLETFDRLLDFLVDAGAPGVCIGGATGEFPHFETADRKALIHRAADRLPDGCALLVGIGAASARLTIELGEAALAAGSRALLLPMPMFFRYEQQDLEAYSAHVSRELRAPVLLYNLPEFTNPLHADTVVRLLRSEEFIVGIKDSSGQLEHIAAFAAARGAAPWTLLVGDDRAIAAGLAAGWNGSISGVAGFCPELLLALYRSHAAGRGADVQRLQGLLDELIAQLAPFPAPWGIRIGLAARGLDTGPLPLPLTAERTAQVAAFTRWFQQWLPGTGLADVHLKDPIGSS